jgi:hypothetical protein
MENRTKTTIGKDSVIEFELYKGRTVQWVMNVNPEYLIGVSQSNPDFDLSDEVLKEARAAYDS